MSHDVKSGPISDDILRNYLADALAPEELARIEKALRDSAELRARLEDVRNDRSDPDLHTLGAIWKRARLTCPNRQQLGSYLLDALDPERAGYIRFHLEVIDCPFCQANLTDLKTKSESSAAESRARFRRIADSSQHLLSKRDS